MEPDPGAGADRDDDLGGRDGLGGGAAAVAPSGEGGKTPPPIVSRSALGALLGPAFRVETPAGVEDGSGGTVGLDLRIQTGGRPELGGELVVGLLYSRVTTAHYGDQARGMIYVPWMIGLASNPALVRGARRELRLDLGVDLGGLSRIRCDDCAAEMLPTHVFLVAARAGLDAYFPGDGGIGVDAIFHWAQLRRPHRQPGHLVHPR